MANPQVPTRDVSAVNMVAFFEDYGGVEGYSDAGGAEADAMTGLVQAETDITALEDAVGTYGGGNDLATDLAAAETDITALEDAVGTYAGENDVATDLAAALVSITAIETDLESAADEVVVPLGSLRWNTGAAIAAFADNTTDGFELSGSECLGIRWNNDTAPRITVAGEFHVPSDWDDTAATALHFEGFRVGSADAAMVLTVTAFAQEVGDAYTADADAGGDTTAFDGATTVITDETLDFAAGVLPAGSKVSFTAVADAALDGDDFVLTGIKLVGTRKMRTA
jgi:hypothetical protein